MSDERKIRFKNQELGILSIDRLYRMAANGKIDHTAEFWSNTKKAWRPLSGIIFDIEPSRIDEMRSAGITKVEVIGSGVDACLACKALEGRAYAIDQVPILPPTNCTCVPWCRSVVVAKQ